MSEVKILVPNGMVDDFKKMTFEDLKRIMASYYYNDYKHGDRGLADIADKINISVYELIDIYGDMELPLIVGDINDYENELHELEKVL